ncbi:hypothetical protein GGH16_004094, partial [Coemansia sp. RSA 560]
SVVSARATVAATVGSAASRASRAAHRLAPVRATLSASAPGVARAAALQPTRPAPTVLAAASN